MNRQPRGRKLTNTSKLWQGDVLIPIDRNAKELLKTDDSVVHERQRKNKPVKRDLTVWIKKPKEPTTGNAGAGRRKAKTPKRAKYRLRAIHCKICGALTNLANYQDHLNNLHGGIARE